MGGGHHVQYDQGVCVGGHDDGQFLHHCEQFQEEEVGFGQLSVLWLLVQLPECREGLGSHHPVAEGGVDHIASSVSGGGGQLLLLRGHHHQVEDGRVGQLSEL